MALTLSASLTAHQRAARKRPTLAVTATPTRFGVPILQFFPDGDPDAEPSAPVAAVYNAAAVLTRARNNAGSLDVSVDFAAWSNVDTVTAGQGFALAFDPVAGVVLLAYGDGNDLKLRSSADGFATPTTLVTEASPIGAVALAVRASNGNACAFYALGTSTTVKRLRRTTGTWAGSGTTWTKTADVASVTGLAAVHAANYNLLVTGTEATTTDEKVYAVAMGDGPIPANAWSGFVTVAEADAAASLSFAYPSLAYVNDVLFGLFQQTEAGDVAATRLMLTSTTESGNPLAHWTEPFPPYQLGGADHGAALAADSLDDESFAALAGPAQTAFAVVPDSEDLSELVVSCSWRETPDSLRLRLELTYAGGPPIPNLGRTVLGWDLTVQHGFFSGAAGAAQFGITLRANIARVTRRFAAGEARVVIDADGPWEAFARYRAPQAWTAPATFTRGQIFSRVAGRAGVEMGTAGGSRAPSTAWSSATPGFALAAGERASTTLARLLAPTPDFTRIDGTGAVQICGSFDTEDEPDVDEIWRLPARSFDHPLTRLAILEETQVNWVRLTAEDRYADSFAHIHGLTAESYGSVQTWPVMDHARDLSADDDTETTEGAQGALLRHQWLTPRAELVGAVNLAQELYDVINVQLEATDEHFSMDPGLGRIISRGVDYKRGPSGSAFDSVLTLGRVAFPA